MDATKLLKDLAEEAGLETEDKTDEEIAAEVADMAETAKGEAETKKSGEGDEEEAPVTETAILDALASVATKVAEDDTEDEDTDDEDV